MGAKRLRYVVLPLLRPAIVVTTVLTFVDGLSELRRGLRPRGHRGGAGGATDVVGTLIYRTAFGTGAFSSTANLGYSEANAVGVMVVLAVGLVSCSCISATGSWSCELEAAGPGRAVARERASTTKRVLTHVVLVLYSAFAMGPSS